jgi:glyoxylase-like metal-dependent hydrolase (beta-lactamase superfamily II)
VANTGTAASCTATMFTYGAAGMAERVRKQEQQPATDEITEVAPGVLRAQLPIDLPGLGHVNCYVLEDERGVAVVDPGLPGQASLRALRARLRAIGVPLRRVHTVVVTHSHPDHYGGAGWLRRESGADIVTHRRFRMMWDPTEPPDVDVEVAAEWTERARSRMPWQPPPWGGEGYPVPVRRRVLMTFARRFPRLARLPTPSVRLDDAATIRLARRDWVALHTPGHTDDHLCLFDPTEGVMVSGDHVLPTITPHIGGYVRDDDPLARFFDSLDKVAAYGPEVSVALPAHGEPFTDLAGRAHAIRRHHEDRLATLRGAVAGIGRPARVGELSQHLFSARAQGPMADSETFAHLEHLRRAGEAERHVRDDGYEYTLTG